MKTLDKIWRNKDTPGRCWNLGTILPEIGKRIQPLAPVGIEGEGAGESHEILKNRVVFPTYLLRMVNREERASAPSDECEGRYQDKKDPKSNPSVVERDKDRYNRTD